MRAENVSLLAVRESDPCFKITYCSCLSSAQRFRSMRAFYTMMAPTSPLQQDTVSQIWLPAVSLFHQKCLYEKITRNLGGKCSGGVIRGEGGGGKVRKESVDRHQQWHGHKEGLVRTCSRPRLDCALKDTLVCRN